MSPVHRFIAALSGVLFLQLSLLASGTVCAMHSDGATNPLVAAHDMSSMPGMPQASVAQTMARASAAAPAPAGEPASRRGCDSSSRSDGCRLPWTPGQCASMTSCAATAATSPSVVTDVALTHAASELPEPASIHSGPAAAPELPPPRA